MLCRLFISPPRSTAVAAAAILVSRRTFSAAASNAVTISLEGKYELYVPEGYKGKFTGPVLSTTTTKEEALDLLRKMQVIRRVEQASDAEYKVRNIRGFCHLYMGQEAVCVGMEAAITFNDCLITAYRDHGNQLSRGDTPFSVMSEQFGKVTGCSKGKGGSMHLYKRDANFYGGNGIVGAQCPVGAGLAFAQKYLGEKHASFALYGDGAANQGQLDEAKNMAALWHLPVVFVCENNHYGMGTAQDRAAAETHFFKRSPFIPGIKVDGMDVFAVREACRFAAAHAVEYGPVTLEFDTYRYSGHSMSDPGISYRTREEVAEVRAKRDPIEGLRLRMEKAGLISQDEFKSMEKVVRKEVDDAVQAAKDAQLPPPSELWSDVYVGEEQPLRGVEARTGNSAWKYQ